MPCLSHSHAPAGIGTLSLPEARLVYWLSEPDVHGRQALRLPPLELHERLARLVPPPRIHRHRYHGVLAPNARLRSTVVSIGRPESDDTPAGLESPLSPDHGSHPGAPPDRSDDPGRPTGPTPRSRSSHMLWAQLLARVLLHLDLPHRPLRVSPARGAPQAELHLDQSPAFDLVDPDGVPEFKFHQSPPHDWEI